MQIDRVTMADLPAILRIERAGFTAAEAGTATAFTNRIQSIPDTFLVAKIDKQICGFIVGPVANQSIIDDHFYEYVDSNPVSGNYLLVLSLAVDPAFRGKGIGSQLLTAFAAAAQNHRCKGIALDSLAKNVPFYERNGFSKVGISPSSHAGETWYNMVKRIN